MNKCAEFCRQTLMILNAIAVVKSVDFILAGAVLNVLEPVVKPDLTNMTIMSADHSDHVTGQDLYDNTWLFMLVTGPIIFIVSVLGFLAAQFSHRLALAFFIILQVLLIIVIIILSVTKIPAALISPTPEWHPLSTFILTAVLIVCACQGLMILFSMAVISSLREESKPAPKQPSRRDSVLDTPRRRPSSVTFRRFSMR